MKKRIMLIVLALACLLVLAGCGCDHDWEDANCDTPKTCVLCGETEGEALGHDWEDADCVTPKTCAACGVAEGEALGHTWIDATCAAPKTCTVCGETEGETLEHTWVDATTEAPKTCEVCGETEGERIITDERFTTSAALAYMGDWKGQVSISGSDMGIDGLDADVLFDVLVTFENDGDLLLVMDVADADAFKASMYDYLVASLYAEFAALGYGEEDADAGMQAAYGMTIPEYSAAYLESLDVTTLTQTMNMVYYVDGNVLYTGDTWDGELLYTSHVLDGDSMSITITDVSDLNLTRVTE